MLPATNCFGKQVIAGYRGMAGSFERDRQLNPLRRRSAYAINVMIFRVRRCGHRLLPDAPA